MKSFEDIQAEIRALRDEKESKYRTSEFYRKEAIREDILSEQEQMHFAQEKREMAARMNFDKLKKEIKAANKKIHLRGLAVDIDVAVMTLRKWRDKPIDGIFDEQRLKLLDYFGEAILDPAPPKVEIDPEIEAMQDEFESWGLVG